METIEEKGKYYRWIYNQVKELKWAYGDLEESLYVAALGHYFPEIDKEEFHHSFEWAMSDAGLID